eukprot:s36_g46.t1
MHFPEYDVALNAQSYWKKHRQHLKRLKVEATGNGYRDSGASAQELSKQNPRMIRSGGILRLRDRRFDLACRAIQRLWSWRATDEAFEAVGCGHPKRPKNSVKYGPDRLTKAHEPNARLRPRGTMPEYHPGTDVEIPSGVPSSGFRNAIPNAKRYMKHNMVEIKAVCEASYTGDYAKLQEMLATGDEKTLFNGDLNGFVNNITALHMAAMAGQTECVELLLKAKAQFEPQSLMRSHLIEDVQSENDME